MRFVQVTLPEGSREQVLDILDEEGVDYVLTEATHDPDYEGSVFFPLPTGAVEPILDSLNEAGIEEEAHSVVLAAETVVSKRFEDLQKQYENVDTGEERVAFEELRTQGREFIPPGTTYFLLTVVSAIIATAGLLLDSAAIVVGSMVIAPLIGPSMATSVGTVLFEQDLFSAGLKHQAWGLALAVASATLFAFLARTLFLVPPNVEIAAIEQIAGRLTPDLLSLVVALGAGIAGARSLSSDISTGLVGVMIAAALVPPIGAVGIGLAWWLPDVVFNAGLLVFVNVVSINLAALATLWYSGHRPSGWWERTKARIDTRRRLASMAGVVLALSLILAAFTVGAYQTAAMTQSVRSEVTAVLGESQYAELTLQDVQVRYQNTPLRTNPNRVIVTVLRPSGEEFPGLANRIDRRVERRTNDNVATQVRFIDIDTGEQ